MPSLKKKIIIGVVGIFFLGATVLMMIGVFKTPQFDREWREISVTSTGVVVDTINDYRNRAYVHYPVVEYVLPNGTTSSFESETSFSRSVYKVGTVVPITYSKNDPAVVFIDNDPESKGMRIALVAMGVVYLGVSVLCFRWLFKRRTI